MSDSLVYLYALVAGDRPPSLTRAPEGLPGTGPLRLAEGGKGVWLVIAPAPPDRYGTASIERGLKDLDWVSQSAVAHERVVRHFARNRTTVPARLFTLFRSEERALEHVRQSTRRLAKVFTRVDGCEEWGLRIFADAPVETASGAPLGAESADAGRRFLERKRALHQVARDLAAQAPRAARSLYRAVARSAREHREIPVVPGTKTRLLIDGAFLVRREERRDFRAAVATAVEAAAKRGVRVSLTGPWPPYNFVGEAQ